MPANTTPIFTLAARWSAARFITSDGTSVKTLFTAGTNGSRLEGLWLNSTEATDNDVFFYIEIATLDFRLHHADVPAGAGNDGLLAAASAFNDVNSPFVLTDVNGNRYLDLPPNAVLKARVGRAVESGTTAAAILNAGGSEVRSIEVLILAQDY